MSKLVYLNRSKPVVRIFRSQAGSISMEIDHEVYSKISIVRCFPYTIPDKHISVKSESGAELYTIDCLSQLSEESRLVVEEALRERYMIPRITRIASIKKRGAYWSWSVDTDYGATRLMMMNLHETIRQITPARWIVTDQDGRRFEFSKNESLDAHSLKQWGSIKFQ
ncbi:conserved hypothetical protein [Paenibacillus curdlanolyticus YK9]|uniref:DUF1854 domain-containing protein n=1 Tax=Paenibacillus curdlanolyticus YK9 TaxID=717606 RepID=E0I793_9BACL|nr:DUF1854 domain-containing protein [Paenibacillus curdlanolyticus]EFM11909.1 conserved hypothetical protein [Paenibacillus curdlanolyticus YK9]